MTGTTPRGIEIEAGDALVVVDLQRDFLPGGPLGLKGADEIVPVLQGYLLHFQARGLPVFLVRDWHPPDHCSFRERGGPWPVHCVAGSPGSLPPPGFQAPPAAIVVHKGTSPDREAYSGFESTPLDRHLREAGVRRLFLGGLATDYCVVSSVRDARRLGYEVCLLIDAIRAIDVHPGDGKKAEAEMIRLGAIPLRREGLVS